MRRVTVVTPAVSPSACSRAVRSRYCCSIVARRSVIVSPNDLEVRFRPNGIEVLALELQPEPEPADEAVEEAVA